MKEIKNTYLPAVIPKKPVIPEAKDILDKALKKTQHEDYVRRNNTDLYERIDKEENTEIKDSLLKIVQKPDIEAVAMIAAKNLATTLDKMNYGIMSQGDDFYIYNGFCWKLIERLRMKHFVTKFLMKTGVEKHSAENASTIDRYVRQFCYSLYAPCDETVNKVARINALNKTITIDTNGSIKEREHRKEDKFFYVLPYEYDRFAVCPKFKKFLDEVIPGDIQLVTQEFFGTCLITSIKHEKVLCCVGTGANGKSVLFSVVSYVLGSENVTTYNINSLCDERSTTRRGIEHKLLNYSSDFSGKIWNNGFFKQLASGEPIEARSLYHDPVIMTNYARLAYNSNSMPESSDTSAGFRRRLLIVEFQKTIEKSKRDPLLADKLITEAPGILNWMIEGLIRFIRNGNKFSHSSVLESTASQYQQATDSIVMFMDDRGYVPGNIPMKVSDLHNEYKLYCQTNSIKNVVGKHDFKMRLEGYGYKIKKENKKAMEVLVDRTSHPNIAPFSSPKV